MVAVCLAATVGFLLGLRTSTRKADKKTAKNQELAEKNKTQFFVTLQWLKLRQAKTSAIFCLKEVIKKSQSTE